MTRILNRLALGFLVALVGTISLVQQATATPMSSCNADSTVCDIYEDGQFFQPGFLFISGDVVLREFGTGLVSDVLRFFNDVFDSGSGTGLGETMFLYSDDEHNLPDPSTFSANAVFLIEGGIAANGFKETDYFNDGTLYRIFSSAPEPSTWQLLVLAFAMIGAFGARGRTKN